MKKTGFTLAEILITIGVIGVVTVITLPALLSSFEKQITATTYKESMNIITSAIATAEANEITLEPNSSANDFLEYIKPYISIAKACENNETECGLIDTLCLHAKDTGLSLGKRDHRYILSNGVFLGADSTTHSEDGSSANNLSRYSDSILVYFDTNGSKPPNRVGYDVFITEYIYNNARHNYHLIGIPNANSSTYWDNHGGGAGGCDNKKNGEHSNAGRYCGLRVRAENFKITYR